MQLNLIETLGLTKKKVVHCIGDSHAEIFQRMDDYHQWRNTRFKCCIVGGATSMGMVNPNSKTQALLIFRNYIREQVKKKETILLSLGEVDCGFVIWYRAQKYGESVEDQLRTSLDNYFSFIDELRENGYENVIIYSATLPTIADDQDWGEVANLRKEVNTSLRERTELTQRYNESLRDYCHKHNIIFLDLEIATLNPATGVVDDAFLNDDPMDHHLNSGKLSPILVEKLNGLGFD